MKRSSTAYHLGFGLMLCALLCAPPAHAGLVADEASRAGNCDPFLCDDSGLSTGQAIDDQPVDVAGWFAEADTIEAMNWPFNNGSDAPNTFLGGSSAFEWRADGPDSENAMDTGGFTPFLYDPAVGELWLEITVTNRDSVVNGLPTVPPAPREPDRSFNR